MKKIFNILFIILVAAGFSACDPQEDNSHTLGNLPTDNQLSFTATPSATNPNIIELRNTSQTPGIVTWDLGNGVTAKGETVLAPYPFEGSYTILMTLYTKSGTVTKSDVVIIKKDDFSLLDTPGYNALTGGASKPEGKTWVFDQYYDGHFGVGPAGGDAPTYWPCPANGKEGTSLYKQEFTFIQMGTKLIWKNKDSIYTNNRGLEDLNTGEFRPNPNGKGDNDVKYIPNPEYTFAFNEAGMELTLSKGAFLGFYIGPKDDKITYKVLKLTNDEIYLKGISTIEPGNAWFYRLIPKEKNLEPQVILRAVQLKETFENNKPSVSFKGQDLGAITSTYYDNPSPFPINSSAKVCLYQKTEALYSNLYFIANGYKFDLTKQNKIKMKVFIPSKNNYDGNLKPQVAVKLQNNDLAGNAWQTQAAITLTEKDGIVMDEWVSLTFDFGKEKDVPTRTDLDKIVIQFGDEGHSTPGIFYFDDFSFEE